ncbi:MAG: hypothetical protein ACYC61_04330 [Isosphaeraceae bacterium]
MSYRELAGQLEAMSSSGIQYVTVDRRCNGDGSLVPIDLLIDSVLKSITDVENSDAGKAMKLGLQE